MVFSSVIHSGILAFSGHLISSRISLSLMDLFLNTNSCILSWHLVFQFGIFLVFLWVFQVDYYPKGHFVLLYLFSMLFIHPICFFPFPYLTPKYSCFLCIHCLYIFIHSPRFCWENYFSFFYMSYIILLLDPVSVYFKSLIFCQYLLIYFFKFYCYSLVLSFHPKIFQCFSP